MMKYSILIIALLAVGATAYSCGHGSYCGWKFPARSAPANCVSQNTHGNQRCPFTRTSKGSQRANNNRDCGGVSGSSETSNVQRSCAKQETYKEAYVVNEARRVKEFYYERCGNAKKTYLAQTCRDVKKCWWSWWCWWDRQCSHQWKTDVRSYQCGDLNLGFCPHGFSCSHFGLQRKEKYVTKTFQVTKYRDAYRCVLYTVSCSLYCGSVGNGVCNRCSNGYYLHGGKCHRPSHGHYADGYRQHRYTNCANGQELQGYSQTSNGRCVRCPTGQTKKGGDFSTRCSTCATGTYADGNHVNCNACGTQNGNRCQCHSGERFCAVSSVAQLNVLHDATIKKIKDELKASQIATNDAQKIVDGLKKIKGDYDTALTKVNQEHASCLSSKQTHSRESSNLDVQINNANDRKGKLTQERINLNNDNDFELKKGNTLSNQLSTCNTDVDSLTKQNADVNDKYLASEIEQLLTAIDGLTHYSSALELQAKNAFLYYNREFDEINTWTKLGTMGCWYPKEEIPKRKAMYEDAKRRVDAYKNMELSGYPKFEEVKQALKDGNSMMTYVESLAKKIVDKNIASQINKFTKIEKEKIAEASTSFNKIKSELATAEADLTQSRSLIATKLADAMAFDMTTRTTDAFLAPFHDSLAKLEKITDCSKGVNAGTCSFIGDNTHVQNIRVSDKSFTCKHHVASNTCKCTHSAL